MSVLDKGLRVLACRDVKRLWSMLFSAVDQVERAKETSKYTGNYPLEDVPNALRDLKDTVMTVEVTNALNASWNAAYKIATDRRACAVTLKWPDRSGCGPLLTAIRELAVSTVAQFTDSIAPAKTARDQNGRLRVAISR